MKKGKSSLLFHEISAGGVVVKKEKNKLAIVVINRHDMKDWTLPKGHQEKGESLQQTAIREVLEETGVKAVPAHYIGTFNYSVKGLKNGAPNQINKTVHWFLMNYIDSKLIEPNREVEKIKWVPIDKSFSFMSYNNDRDIIKKAIKIIKLNPDLYI